ncbi:hypothetical protein AL522_23230 [Pantoea vagans]|nr:hypothetical protein AL522_23230 [Pantoea vagans]
MGHGLAYLPGSGWAVLAILTYMCTLRWLRALVHRPGLLVRLWLGSARHPHVLRVRSGGCALSARNLAAPPTAFESDAECAADGLECWFEWSRRRPSTSVK